MMLPKRRPPAVPQNPQVTITMITSPSTPNKASVKAPARLPTHVSPQSSGTSGNRPTPCRRRDVLPQETFFWWDQPLSPYGGPYTVNRPKRLALSLPWSPWPETSSRPGRSLWFPNACPLWRCWRGSVTERALPVRGATRMTSWMWRAQKPVKITLKVAILRVSWVSDCPHSCSGMTMSVITHLPPAFLSLVCSSVITEWLYFFHFFRVHCVANFVWFVTRLAYFCCVVFKCVISLLFFYSQTFTSAI